MTERDNILVRIRKALSVPAARPGSHGAPGHNGSASKPQSDVRAVLPAVGASLEANLALFAKNADELKADFFVVQNFAELHARLVKLRDAEGWKKIGAHGGKLTEPACAALGLPVCRTDQPFAVPDLECCDAGLTECDALVAQTGSVLLTSRSAGGRALSVLPPHHVVLARHSQLLAGLPDAFALLKQRYGTDYPSMISFVTGPSRTGDIERILVLGAHGPKKLTIFCVASDA